MMDYSTQEEIIKISDYNRIARLYGTEQYELNEDEYIVICNFDNMASLRSQVLSIGGNKLTIAGKQYKSKYNECKNGFIAISTNHTNTGIILVPDSCALTEESKAKSFLVANYNAKTDKEKEKIEEIFSMMLLNYYKNYLIKD